MRPVGVLGACLILLAVLALFCMALPIIWLASCLGFIRSPRKGQFPARGAASPVSAPMGRDGYPWPPEGREIRGGWDV